MSLDDAGSTLTLGDPAHLDPITRLEHFAHIEARSDRRDFSVADAELTQDLEGFHCRFLEVTLHGLVGSTGATLTKTELRRAVSIPLGLSRRHHRTGTGFDDRDRQEHPGL